MPEYNAKERLNLDPKVVDNLPRLTAEDLKDKKVISVNNYWYDVTTFAKYHPGGEIINRFTHMEATSFFYGMHRNPEKILRRFKPIGINPENTPNAGLTKDYLKLYTCYSEKGYFIADKRWIVLTNVINIITLLTGILSTWMFPSNNLTNGLMLGFFMILCAGMTHDSGHRVHTYIAKYDDWIAWIYGNVLLGANASWWREEHDDHHGHPLTFDD